MDSALSQLLIPLPRMGLCPFVYADRRRPRRPVLLEDGKGQPFVGSR
jgi:hypothetical protein